MLHAFWTSMDPRVRESLLVGSVGKQHLMAVARLALPSPEARTADLGRALVLAAWETDPLDGDLARELLRLPGLADTAPERTLLALRTVAERFERPPNLDYYRRVAVKRDYDRLRRFLDGELGKHPESLFWLRSALTLAAYLDDRDWGLSLLPDSWPDELAGIGLSTRADMHFFRGEYNTALAHYEQARQAGAPGDVDSRTAECLLRLGRRDEALDIMARIVRDAPWHANILCRLADLLRGVDLAAEPLPGPASVLLYSFNKADELDLTLASLHESRLGEARVVVLNNGSTDRTPEVLSTWQDRFGERLLRVDTPVNIGAPAARNWLMHMREVAEREFAVYLDDDVLLPPDWLEKLGAAHRLMPGASVWGCQVIDQHTPSLIQSADFHLRYNPDVPENLAEPDLSRIEPNPFYVTDLQIQDLEFGRFGYLRPCVSVTGCCHLFRTKELRETGDFRIQLSPSQFDDLERDLRMAAGGGFACYQGHLQVRHMKRSGKASLVRRDQKGNAMGNKYKMQVMHPPQEIRRIMAEDTARLEADLLTRAALLDRELEGS